MQLVASAGLVPTAARTLSPFKLYRPRSAAAALGLLRGGEQPVLLAGGTDLVASFNEGLQPRELITLAGVAELHQISADEVGVRIGAALSHHCGSGSAELRRRAPGFARDWSRIASPRIRLIGTLGGNLMARRTRYEAALLLCSLAARLEFFTPQGAVLCPPQALWEGALGPVDQRPALAGAPALLTHIVIDTNDLLASFHERSMRPLLTLAGALRRGAQGLRLRCALATEYLPPVVLELVLSGSTLAQVAAQAAPIAEALMAQLPQDFNDPALGSDYARAAGTALLLRQLRRLADG